MQILTEFSLLAMNIFCHLCVWSPGRATHFLSLLSWTHWISPFDCCHSFLVFLVINFYLFFPYNWAAVVARRKRTEEHIWVPSLLWLHCTWLLHCWFGRSIWIYCYVQAMGKAIYDSLMSLSGFFRCNYQQLVNKLKWAFEGRDAKWAIGVADCLFDLILWTTFRLTAHPVLGQIYEIFCWFPFSWSSLVISNASVVKWMGSITVLYL